MTSTPKRHGRTALLIGGLAVGMFGVGFAMAPYYGQICAALGIQVADTPTGKGQRIALGPPSANPVVRPVTVRFDATVNGNLPWEFEPVQRRMDIDTGRLYTASYTARNLSDQPITGRAVVSVR